ncbi:Ig-like domain repeat protein [Corynebacterium freneyi]|uniref:Ig-like domain-containing protein n=1 Tax=Corynebacterium freneyi TaxID=134034 RepID=UPI00254B4AA3|nr:Ig-like domain repeat protein [Corynebacterium freneyi]MDK8768931.1 Ig-like domain repeat protein [Corynebacterium freneyi]
MKLKTFRLPAAAAAVAALTFGLITLPGGDDALAAPVTETKTVTNTCAVHKGWNSTGPGTNLTTENLTVTYPKQVLPGETFAIELQPGQMTTTAKQIGRIKYDFVLPNGVDITNLRIAGAGTALEGTPTVQRVNESGNVDANGRFARIWDGANSVNNGGSQNDSWGGGGTLKVGKNQTFRLPKIAFDVTAPSEPGTTIVTGLRGAGVGSSIKSTNNSISFVATDWVTDAVYCNANAAGTTLTSTLVALRDTQTAFAETSTNLEVTSGGGPTALTANVTHDDGSPVTEGEVEFDFGDGSPTVTVPVNNGVATTEHTYPELDDRNPVGHTATARYLGVQGRTKPSEDTTTVTVNPVPREQVQATVDLTGNVKVDEADNGQVPVELRASVGAEDGKTLPEGVEVVFHQGDAEVGRATVVDGVAATTVSVPDEKATLTFRAVVSDMETDTQELTGAEATTDVDVAPVSRTSISVELEDDGVLVGRRTTITAKYSATPSIPEGTEVIFRADGIRIGTATVGSDGVATIEHSFDAAGPKRITALVEKREVDGRVYPRAESEAAVLTVAAPAGQDTTTDLTYTRPDVDVEAEVLTGDLIRFIATVDAGDSTIAEGASVSFFDGDTFLGTAPVDPATGRAVFDHRFAERGEHQVRAVFNGQEKKDGEGVITEVLEPSESDPVTLDVREHDVVIEEPGDEPGDDPDEPGDDPSPNPGDGSGSWGSSGSSSGNFLASVIGFLGNLGIIGTFLMSIFGLHAI